MYRFFWLLTVYDIIKRWVWNQRIKSIQSNMYSCCYFVSSWDKEGKKAA